MPLPKPLAGAPAGNILQIAWWRRWWSLQSPMRQDRFAMLAPLAAVLLFLAAIVAAFAYLRFEEIDREQEAVKRDVEYAQQRLRLRGLDQERAEACARLQAMNPQVGGQGVWGWVNGPPAMLLQHQPTA